MITKVKEKGEYGEEDMEKGRAKEYQSGHRKKETAKGT